MASTYNLPAFRVKRLGEDTLYQLVNLVYLGAQVLSDPIAEEADGLAFHNQLSHLLVTLF